MSHHFPGRCSSLKALGFGTVTKRGTLAKYRVERFAKGRLIILLEDTEMATNEALFNIRKGPA